MKNRKNRKKPIGCKAVADVVVHSVIPEDEGGMFNVHTHGLDAHGHKEFQALVPGYTVPAVVALLRDLVNCVLGGESFEPEQEDEIRGHCVKYVEVPGDFPEEPTRLRIVDSATPCDHCHR
jgi:hypothetical protein